MSKKNLSLLMDGFMGEANQTESVQEQPKEQATEQAEKPTTQTAKQVSSKTATKKDANETETTEKMKSRLEAKRRENVGRPKKGETVKSAKKPQEIRATFIVDLDLLQKVKYISLVEGVLLKDVISEALNNYVDKWETNNRKIRLPKRK